ncbi:MAG: gliding motility-associated C-terminal domain-containing protein [Bacteroidales bacterium]|nr:gliding motility-associated C-terminal domain-containing protein [Bacteroidales bacterium]
MSDKLNIEQLFSTKLGEAEMTPSPDSWKKIDRKLRWRQFNRFNPRKLNIFYVGGLLIIGAGLIALITTNRPDSGGVVRAPEPESGHPGIITDQGKESAVEIAENDQGDVNDKKIGSAPERQKSANGVPGHVAEQSENSKVSDPEEIEIITDDDRSMDVVQEEMAYNTLITYFTCSVQSGCAPLTVQFFNQSVNEESFHWSFGKSERILMKDPVYIFKEPGKYAVTLTADNAKGQTSSYHQIIEVYPSPVAEFEIEEGLESIDGVEELNLLNYSAGAFSFSWSLIGKSNIICSNWSSNEFQPSIKLSDINQDATYLRLVATTGFACTDSSIQVIPVYQGSATTLRFPTAFSPNPTGPGGGSYSPHEKRIDLFHPVFEDVPREYNLRIYTRRGELVYETRDIYKGWDGYILQERSAGGVYVWMAEGIRENGEEFKLRGDVTLIWDDQR